ncbi:LysR family transcriptional regulator [Burkholderia pseudomallei]|nr:LysR family transcriptional regulator [Burkholderia pseudomallei]
MRARALFAARTRQRAVRPPALDAAGACSGAALDGARGRASDSRQAVGGQPAGGADEGADEGAAASGRASMLHVEGVVYRSVCATPARPVELTLAYRQDNDNPLFGAPKDVPRKSLTASR